MKTPFPFTVFLPLIGIGVVFQQCTAEQSSDSIDTNTIFHTVEEIRIGKIEGENEYVFGSIHDIDVGKNGVIFVADRQVPVIRMYDKDGRFLRDIGREGRGPGEYQYIIGMHTFADGRLAVLAAKETEQHPLLNRF